MKERVLSVLLMLALALSLLPTVALADDAAEPYAQLEVGRTYYFDLSSVKIPGTVNEALPDTTLHYVPFTYVGEVYTYRLENENQTAMNAGVKDRCLFIAEYNITHTVSWDELKEAGLIYGTEYKSNNISYTLRAPSILNSNNFNTIEWKCIQNKLSALDTKATKVTIEVPEKASAFHPGWAAILPLAGDNNPFRDVRAMDWFYEDVMHAYERGLVNGTAFDKFSPQETFTRGMLLTILARHDGVRTNSTPWYQAGCDWALANGISDGKSPEEAISREEFAQILYRYAAYRGSHTLAGNDISGFTGVGAVSPEALPAV